MLSKLLHRFQPNFTHTHYKSKMADGRHLGKIEKSPYLGHGSTDIDEIWQDDAQSVFLVR